MKRAFVLLLLAALLGLCGCEHLVKSDYLSVTPHVEQSLPASEETEEELPLTVTNRNELRGTVLSFIRDWTESGTIPVEGYTGDIAADLSETMRYATQEDPVGAYAVDYADAELIGNAEKGSIEISIVFRRSAAEIDAIVTVSGNSGAYRKIRQALANYDTALTLRIRNYTETDFAAYIRTYCLEHPEAVGALPMLFAEVYPDVGKTRILELHFSYPNTRDEMRVMLDSVNTILRSASAYIRSGTDDLGRAELLARFLTTRFAYTIADEEPAMPAYDLLCEGKAHSLSFASVFFAECAGADIDCVMVSGTRGGEPHYWNMLQLDGVYYHIDLMRQVERGEKTLTLLSKEMLLAEGYAWDFVQYPSNPASDMEQEGVES